MNQKLTYKSFICWVIFIVVCYGNGYAQYTPDTTKKTLIKVNGDDLNFLNFRNQRSLFLNQPENIRHIFEYDPETKTYILRQKIGNIECAPPIVMSFDEYQEYIAERNKFDFWKSKSQLATRAGVQDGIIPSIYVGSNLFENVFGSNLIEIRPQGSAELTFGFLSNHRKNETLDVRQRRTTSFDFNEKIQMSVVAKIGDKIEFKTNYNTESTFEFENNLKLRYEGEEDEIIQLIEAGDVNFSLPTTLINGSQGLFGVKTKLRFGKTTVTGVFSQQESETSTITVQGGAQTNEFNLTALDYEENRHFFLGQYFREDINVYGETTNRYNYALRDLRFIDSKIIITRVEVWVTNIGAAVGENRNIIAFTDLGEFDPYNSNINSKSSRLPSNESNDLIENMDEAKVRDINSVTKYLQSDPLNVGGSNYFVQGEDFEKVESARKLSPSEYTFNSKLGFISLNTSLGPDQTLAVAFQYTVLGDSKVYQVGEFSDQGINSPKNLIVKLLKSTAVNTKNPMWDLMMKNVYSMQAYQVNPDDFIFNILYSGNEKGVPTAYFSEGGEEVKGIPLIRLLGMDKLDQNMNPPGDGLFDFIDNAATNGGTIQSANGRIFFPVLEPFGKDIRNLFSNPDLADKYAYDSLYTMTKSGAEQYPEKNKYVLEGFFKSSTSNEISLNAFNIPEGSVKVTAGGIPLTENLDYIVDYTLGRVTLLNEGILNSGTPINISMESNSMFNMQSKRYMGLHVNHEINERTNIGATIINLNERPITQKTNYGDDPISNTIWGLNFNYEEESKLLTRLVNKIPLIKTNAPSRVNIEGEFAHFIPGHSNVIGETGISYIDDFEGTKSSIDLKSHIYWNLASTPQGQTNLFPEAAPDKELEYGMNRARFAWYVIDPLFYDRNTNYRPSNVTNEELSKHSVRQVLENEVFPNKDIPNGIPTNIAVLNMAFYPQEKGPYNFDVDPIGGISAGINNQGDLRSPETRWGGMMREIDFPDFESQNVEYIEFWLMDPFVDDATNSGKLYFNLGDISEDILRDSRKSFENGLPKNELVVDVDTTIWGRVPSIQSLVGTFTTGSRKYQDVGYDGLSSDDELKFYSQAGGGLHNYIEKISGLFGTGSAAYQKAVNDPSNDDYHYFRGTDFDGDDRFVSVLERYKLYNNPEGNSPSDELNPESYPTSSSSLPNVEDINNDNTLSEGERYYQYEVNLDPSQMQVGQNYITDVFEATTHTLPNGETKSVKWYQFKIPINSPDDVIGSIEDFKSIRFMRTFMRGFKRPVVLRFATLELVRSEWRRYRQSLLRPGEFVANSGTVETTLDISAVNIEENGSRTPIPYVIPPGIEREQNISTTNIVRQNEQSMVLKVENLLDGDARGAFKTTNFDFRQYKKLKMYAHAEKVSETDDLEDGDLTLFIRMGSDFNENYYEYEIPLKLTPWGTSFAEADLIWPDENAFEIDLEELVKIKLDRNVAMREPNTGVTTSSPYVVQNGEHKITILGVPSISDVKAFLVGIRNPKQRSFSDDDDGQIKSAEIWINELRLSDYRSKGGWAATARFSANLADLGRITVSGSHSTPGFGSIEQKVNETQKEKSTNFDFSADIELGKFFPEKSGVKIPVHFDYSKTKIVPEYNPLDPDVVLKDVLDSYKNQAEKDSLLKIVEDVEQRKNINFVNVRKERTGSKKARVYDIENFTFNYAYSEIYARNIDIEHDLRRTYRGGITYNFRGNPKQYKPLNNVKLFSKSPYLRILKDFNFYLLPKQIYASSDMYREYNQLRYRNKSSGDVPMQTYYTKQWDWNRDFNMKFDLSQSLSIDFRSSATAYIDEPSGNPEKGTPEYDAYRKAVWEEIKNFGTLNQYDHALTVNYNLPINKFPVFNWVTSNAKYLSTYNWTASPKSTQDRLGNQIENSMQFQFTGNFNFDQLYDKIPYLKNLKRKSRRGGGGPGFGGGFQRNAGQSKNDSVKRVRPENPIGEKILKVAMNVITGIKRASFTYTKTAGTFLPGFLPEPTILGNARNYSPDLAAFPDLQDRSPSKLAPGIGFVFGDQRDIRNDAIRNGWLTTDTLLNQSYFTKRTTNFSARVSFEPFPDFKVELTADRAYSINHQEYFRADENGYFQSYSPTDNGSFSISFLALGTAFNDVFGDDRSKAFEDMRNNRQVIADRLAEMNPNILGGTEIHEVINSDGITTLTEFPTGYGPDAQDVLMYSFLAAYSGKDPKSMKLKQFPSIPLPNWRLTYSGLTRIPFIKELFRNITISHAYRASYNIGNFVSNVERIMLNGFPAAFYENGTNLISEYDISQISITEQFVPLISVDIVMKNSLSTRFEIKKSRNLSFSFANNQLTEMKSDELVIGLGYRIKNVNLGFRTTSGNNGRTRQVKSDLNIKADFSLRSNKTTLRRMDENINQISAGQEILSINFSADYLVSQKFNLRLYFDRVVNNPFVSSQYPNATTTGGFSLRFFLN